MTYSSDVVQGIFHELPTDIQREYLKFEETLANQGKFLHLEGVMAWEGQLDVVVRIRSKFDDKSG